jgi:hypothetical protein
MLLFTGLIGMSGLCNFSCAFSVGVKGFFVIGILSFSCLQVGCIAVMFSVLVVGI